MRTVLAPLLRSILRTSAAHFPRRISPLLYIPCLPFPRPDALAARHLHPVSPVPLASKWEHIKVGSAGIEDLYTIHADHEASQTLQIRLLRSPTTTVLTL